ncbi:MAG: type II toxin-antitoxin system Phd/YefM family antitoxin [Verrucomicrobiota bacterium]|nr:type II toxin-antitoxin system Phd/YefM family antitoxin [Verrucomicrobiota bacterium]
MSYVKSHASEVIKTVVKTRTNVIITQNGEAKVVLQSISEYEDFQNSLALLKILALGNKDVEKGRIKSSTSTFKNLRKEISKLKEEWQ